MPDFCRKLKPMAVRSLFALIAVVLLLGGAFPARAQAPLPNSLAAIGDSLSRGSGAGPRYFADSSAFSWSTGGDPSVNSLALRIATRNPALAGKVYNVARYGARMADLAAQINTVNAVQVDYVTVLIGGNDACALTETTMTPTDRFRQQFSEALNSLATNSPQASVLVMSIPDPTRLLSIVGGDRRAQVVWDAFAVCQTALLRPLSQAPEDIARRERVRQRVADYNTVLAEVCASHPRCRYDGGAVFNAPLSAADISSFDFFHLSAQGQTRLAELAWAATGFEP